MHELRGFHAHIYFNPDELGTAQRLAHEASTLFNATVGRFHERPVGPHPRGSCQLTIAKERFGEFTEWAALNRLGLTIFAHAETGDDLADHSAHVIWFGPSEPLDLSIFS